MNNPFQLIQMVNQIKANPNQFLQKMNIQTNSNNPKEIVQSMLDSGRINQNQLNNAIQQAKQFGIKL